MENQKQTINNLLNAVFGYMQAIHRIRKTFSRYLRSWQKVKDFMRDHKIKYHDAEMEIGRIPIGETEITIKKRSGALPGLCTALKEIFVTPTWNEMVFEILEAKITEGKNHTKRPGIDIWQIFVLSQVRLCQNISYEELHHIANNDYLIRQIMALERGFGYERLKIGYQNIILLISLSGCPGIMPNKMAVLTENTIINYSWAFTF